MTRRDVEPAERSGVATSLSLQRRPRRKRSVLSTRNILLGLAIACCCFSFAYFVFFAKIGAA